MRTLLRPHGLARHLPPLQQPILLLSGRNSQRFYSDRPAEPPPPASSRLNAPISTLPPSLDVPSSNAFPSTFQYLLAAGKAYLAFYKSGVLAIRTNYRLLRDKAEGLPEAQRPRSLLVARPDPARIPAQLSRADWVLWWRVRHDVARVPLFGLLLLVTGEFTPLVILAFDRIVPWTCRIPKQIGGGYEKAERRRAGLFEKLEGSTADGVEARHLSRATARRHILKSLGLVGFIWDRLAFVPPFMWSWKGEARMAFLAGDDAMLVREGEPLSRLSTAEVRMACAERGLDVLGRSEGELRLLLGDWLRLTAGVDAAESRKRMAVLMMLRPEQWPKTPDFELPEWEL